MSILGLGKQVVKDVEMVSVLKKEYTAGTRSIYLCISVLNHMPAIYRKNYSCTGKDGSRGWLQSIIHSSCISPGLHENVAHVSNIFANREI